MKETNDELHVHENAFKGMPNLRFLTIATWRKEDQLQLPESFDYLPPKLRLLCWRKYPMRCMPSKFCPENLVELKMENSKLEKLWEGVLPLTCLKHMDLSGSENLTEIPDLSEAINLETLFLSDCSSLVGLPPSIRNLHRLIHLFMNRCTNLKILPTGINLESLDSLFLSGCCQLKSFPDISTNISELELIHTAIEEVPWWIEKFSRLRHLYMRYCSKLKFVSLNITKLKHHLEKVDFRNCRALTGVDLSGNKSDQHEANIDTKIEMLASSSFPKHVFNFFNCSNLDRDALLKQQSVVFEQLILPGEEVPWYFTHQTTGTSSLTIPLLQSPLLQSPLLQQPFKFRTCFVVGISKYDRDTMSISMILNWRLKGRPWNPSDSANNDLHSFFLAHKGTQLIISDYIFSPPQSNYDHVDIQLDMMSSEDSTFILKGWGIRLVDSSRENRPGNLNILPHVCEANMFNETEQGEECGGINKHEANADYMKKLLTSPEGTHDVNLKYKEGTLDRFRKLTGKIGMGVMSVLWIWIYMSVLFAMAIICHLHWCLVFGSLPIV